MQAENSQRSLNQSNFSQQPQQQTQGQHESSQAQIPVDASIRHFELPNLTQLLYEFTNKEQDIIQQCFRTGNYASLRDLPVNMLPSNISKALRDKQDNNLTLRPPQAKVQTLTGGGLFRDYEYQPDPYDLFLRAKQDERRESKRKQKEIGKVEFTAGMDKFVWKYHDCFLSEEQRKNFVLPYFVSDDPYETTEEELLRAKWLHENKIMSGEFRPALADKSLERLMPSQLPDMVNYLKKVIMVDWAEVNFVIGTNPDSFVEIKFDAKSIDTELGLRAYMNTLVKTHDVISQFNFRRVIKFWGYNDNGFIYFMLAPNWIKFNPGLAYAQILNQQLDDASKGDNAAATTTQPHQTVDNASANRELVDGMSAQEQNLFKIHQIVFKKSSFVKDPTLFSKDIPV